ncbi:hypothetical protein LAZ67_7002036 [Cordylochernes scorpioides]|uniref:ATP-dependent DNA helicase n=1 Tax=Cordylochernes scorpioides TaxID=51811 RepID=A0ABY6KMS0_9ARAC|nr:hypothetical protein LAZ67_7002036 [Cordylochernes scorpioides]
MPRKISAIGVRTPAARRMAARAARGQSSRTLENPHQSQARLQSDRLRHREADRLRHFRQRASTWADMLNAAFHYNPALNYQQFTFLQIGHMDKKCLHCTAFKYNGERPGMCCSAGKVRIPDLPEPPEALRTLLDGSSPHSAEFMQCVRHYNNAFQMTSFGCGSRVVLPGYMPTFKVQGQVYHRIGSVLPPLNSDSRQLQPAFLQVFFIGDSSAEVATRHRNFPITKPHIVSILQDMLHRHNPYVHVHLFKASIEKMPSPDYKLVIKADKASPGHHPRTFNAPTINELPLLLGRKTVTDVTLFFPKEAVVCRGLTSFTDAIRTDRSHALIGRQVIIPSSFVGSPRHMHEYAQDCMAYVRKYGRPDLFITFTCNPEWPEIKLMQFPTQSAFVRHDLVARIFQLKVTKLIDLITKGDVFGKPQCWCYTIEWQKRGLPHAHILLWLKEKIRPNQIDSIICAEIPNEEVDASLFRTVTKNMIPGPCGHGNPNPGCMERGRCQKKYPRLLLAETQTDRDGYPLYRRRRPEEGGFSFVKRVGVFTIENGVQVVRMTNVTIDNRYVVPYSPLLCRLFDAHINAYRPPKTMLTEFFALCQRDNFAKTLLYVEVPVYYIWSASKSWQPRKQGTRIADQVAFASDAIGRVYTVLPNFEECFYLRMLLHSVRGPTSFAALRTINGVLCQTYKEACLHLGLLENDQQWHHCIQEAVISESPLKIRELFAIILTCCHPTNPQDMWAQFKEPMSADILNLARQQANAGLLQLTYKMSNQALILLEQKVLQMTGFHLTKFDMRSPQRNVTHRTSHELLRETSYDLSRLLQFVASNEPKLANVPEQKEAYERILSKIDSNAGGLYFLDAPGGTGKTFLINLLLTKVRSTGDIALSTASSGIAATLLHGGRTAHSTFKLPLDSTRDEVPVCNLNADSAMDEVLRQCKFIVWDECTMAHKHALEAVDITLKDCRQDQRPMGGVVLLLAGDFRQILPIIPRGTIADELHACLKTSPLWSFVERLTLSTNMRAVNSGDPNSLLFSQFLLQLGSGQLNDTDANVNFSNELVNTALLKEIPGQSILYTFVDSTIDARDCVEYTTEFLNSLEPSGMPPHHLELRVGVPIILLRNIDAPRLCNGTRLCVKRLWPHVVEATILTGCFQNEEVFIPRIPLIHDDKHSPLHFKRLQFPIRVSFAMSINKAQGQSLKITGIDLEQPCFSH